MSLDRDAVINATRDRWRRESFAWGSSDCMMGCFDYGQALTGADGGAEWRGAYSDEATAVAVMEAEGGGRAGLAKGMAKIGAAAVGKPARGDIVCIRVGEHEIGGICLGAFTMFRLASRGTLELATRHLDIIGAWRP